MEEVPFKIAKKKTMQIENKRSVFESRQISCMNFPNFQLVSVIFSCASRFKNRYKICRLRDVFLLGVTYRGIFHLEDYFEYHGDLRRVEKMVLSWQEFETRSTSSGTREDSCY